ncbi:hypothetical protein QQX98_005891 [Neonectria punicea]|uniref:Uncharacterized protein n=1 Tax=Neonectria punicea TaxID=979145 RepID=A0ABR1H2X6_9HYPO
MNGAISDQEILLAATAPVHTAFGYHCGKHIQRIGMDWDDEILDVDDPNLYAGLMASDDANAMVTLAKINGMVYVDVKHVLDVTPSIPRVRFAGSLSALMEAPAM